MTKGSPEGKDFTDKQYRAMGVNPDELRRKPSFSEWVKRLAPMEPVDLSTDPVLDIRAVRDGAPGSRLDHLYKITGKKRS